METTGYLDWMGEAEQALRELAKRKSKVFVTGLSMGGTLTLNLAARCPDLVAGDRPDRRSGRADDGRDRRGARAEPAHRSESPESARTSRRRASRNWPMKKCR